MDEHQQKPKGGFGPANMCVLWQRVSDFLAFIAVIGAVGFGIWWLLS